MSLPGPRGAVTCLMSWLVWRSTRRAGERDLIVTTASRRQVVRGAAAAERALVADRRSAGDRLTALKVREASVRRLVDRCVAEIAKAPRLAVPEPDRLGPIPSQRVELDAYLARLARVDRAMDIVERSYGAPLAQRDELRGRFGPYQVMARRSGRDGDPEVVACAGRVAVLLADVPCDVAEAVAELDRYTRLIRPVGVTASTEYRHPTEYRQEQR